MILITTSNGVLGLGAADARPALVLARRKGRFFFRKGSGGFFGISPHPDGDSFLAASREKFGTPAAGKPWTDVRLYRIWPGRGRAPERFADLKDIHDVHQTATAGGLILLTDTGKNRLGVYDCRSGRLCTLDVGPVRQDVNHLNALHVTEAEVMVGLNNRGDKPAEILHLDRALLEGGDLPADALACGRLEVLGVQNHTHDIEPFGDDFLFCASHEGKVMRRSTLEAILHPGDWVRGLAVDADGLWVGVSPLAERSQRHREDLDGMVHLYDPGSLELIRSWTLVGAGQVNDLVSCT